MAVAQQFLDDRVFRILIKVPHGESLNSTSKGATFNLVIPLLHPGVGAHRFKDFLKVVAWLIALTTFFLATMEIHVRLIAVTGLILIGETWIERSSF